MAQPTRHLSKNPEVKNIHTEQVKRASVFSSMEILAQQKIPDKLTEAEASIISGGIVAAAALLNHENPEDLLQKLDQE